MIQGSIAQWQPAQLSPAQLESDLAALARILHDCVAAGASVGFVQPFPLEEAHAYWRTSVLPEVRAGRRGLWIATVDGAPAGTVQLGLQMMPNQAHRAEVMKLLVHPDHRRQGIARLLMSEAIAMARHHGRTLLTLDTRTGDAAEPLYRSLGFETAGVIPEWSRAPDSDRLEATTILYLRLESGS